jgi:fructose-1,6-bisphosphatase/inositol monophosphatase family enzyme
VFGVGVATWVAHLFAELLGERVRHGARVSWAEARRASIDGSPILAATFLPAALLFLGRMDLVSHETARNVAILAAVLQLSLVGAIVARSSPGSPTPAWSFAIATAVAGIGVVALKVALGH